MGAKLHHRAPVFRCVLTGGEPSGSWRGIKNPSRGRRVHTGSLSEPRIVIFCRRDRATQRPLRSRVKAVYVAASVVLPLDRTSLIWPDRTSAEFVNISDTGRHSSSQ